MQLIRQAAKRAPAALGSQKRTAYIELASTHMAGTLFAWVGGTMAYHLPKYQQEKWLPLHHAGVMPVYLAQEEKRNIMQLSKQMDNTFSKWDKLPTEAALRSSSTRL